MQIIKSKLKTLVNATTREPLRVGQQVNDFRGEVHVITGGEAPHKPSSTGRVWTDKGIFYPSVIGAQWV